MVRAIDAGGVVDEVGVDAPAGARVFDAAELGNAEIGALSDHPAAQLSSIHPNRIVRPVAGLGVALALGFDEGTDAAEP